MKIKRILESAAAKFGGAVVKEAIKLLPGGYIAIAGAEIAGIAIESTLEEVANRDLSSREKIRVAVSASTVITKIAKKIEQGEILRDDNEFFTSDGMNNSSAQEIFEGVLLKCKQEHEERKIKFISNIMANIAFEKEVGVYEANQMIKIADTLTYRQLTMISIIIMNENERLNLLSELIVGPEYWEVSYRQELLDLIRLGIVQQVFVDFEEIILTPEYIQERVMTNDFGVVSSWDQIIPEALVLTAFGTILYEYMGLEELPEVDLEITKKLMS